jgi:uncharacterized protein
MSVSSKTVIAAQPWERTHAAWTQATVALALLPFMGSVTGAVVTLILWLQKREVSGYVDDHGREALNMHLSVLLYAVVCMILLPVSIPVIVVLYVVGVVAMVKGILAARDGRLFRYPICLRFVK